MRRLNALSLKGAKICARSSAKVSEVAFADQGKPTANHSMVMPTGVDIFRRILQEYSGISFSYWLPGVSALGGFCLLFQFESVAQGHPELFRGKVEVIWI